MKMKMNDKAFGNYLLGLAIITLLLSTIGIIIAPLYIAGAMSAAGGVGFAIMFSGMILPWGIGGLFNKDIQPFGIGVSIIGLALLLTTIFAPPLAAMIVILVFSSLCLAAAAALAIGSKFALPAEDKPVLSLEPSTPVEPEMPVASYGSTFASVVANEEVTPHQPSLTK